MWSPVAYFLDRFNIRNLCLLYFFVAPMLQDNADTNVLRIVLMVGYAISGSILLLAFADRLSRFSDGIRFTGMSLIVLGMIALCFLTIAINTPKLLFSPGAYYFKYLKLVFPVACFFVMSRLWTIRDANKLYGILLASGACALAFLVPEYLFLYKEGAVIPRLASFFVDSNKYALFLNVIYAFTLPLLIRGRLQGRGVALEALIIAALVLQLFLTQSRGGMITNGVITVACFLPRPARKVALSAWPVFMVIALLFVAGVVARYLGSAEGSQLAQMSNFLRILTYSVGRNIIMDRPFLGIGFANIMQAYDRYGVEESVMMTGPMSIHNATLEIFAEEGFFGMVFYLLLMFVPIYFLVRKIRGALREGRYPVIELAALGIPMAFFGYGLTSPNYLPDDFFWVYMSFTMLVIRTPVPPGFELRIPRFRFL